jgi:hypothetical protein
MHDTDVPVLLRRAQTKTCVTGNEGLSRGPRRWRAVRAYFNVRTLLVACVRHVLTAYHSLASDCDESMFGSCICARWHLPTRRRSIYDLVICNRSIYSPSCCARARLLHFFVTALRHALVTISSAGHYPSSSISCIGNCQQLLATACASYCRVCDSP